MAIKKSDLYSMLWESCNSLRGSMDASQYKDYVLVLLFIKYISDKYADDPYGEIEIPEGASFNDMVKLIGKPDIGNLINTTIIQPLSEANQLTDMPDFNDETKLGKGKEMVERLGKLISIFNDDKLNFASNRADGDDLLGDAYEYLMRHFASESGKSKGQFYTPSEVSRILAQIIGINTDLTTANTTVMDPTTGSGSLLLKVAYEAGTSVTLYGQEKDASTCGLARMNMILHNCAGADIQQGNTIANPHFTIDNRLKQFDYVVANPPFSDKHWSTGIDPVNDEYERFTGFGVPPEKQGDYAYLLHIIKSLKSTGKGACILPHGVLFRGNAEAEIRKNLILKGYIKGIIGLPANLFYGTGIPACIIMIDKENSLGRKGIFMIDASKGFIKDGNKNRLREQDIHKIVDSFNKQIEIPRYSRMVSFEEIMDPKNDFNLNLPRYIDSSETEDIQDIDGHIRGGIPEHDLDELAPYWSVMPSLKNLLFKPFGRAGYTTLTVGSSEVKQAILNAPEFADFKDTVNSTLAKWLTANRARMNSFDKDQLPRELISFISENMLEIFNATPLIDTYDLFQHLMDFWAETMQDDAYLISGDGWKAETYRVVEVKKGKNGANDKEVDKGWLCDLIPKQLIVSHYFAKEQSDLEQKESELDTVTASLTELEEEHSGDDGVFGEMEKVNKAEVTKRFKEIKGKKEYADESAVLKQWIDLNLNQTELKADIKTLDEKIDRLAYEKYPTLTEPEIKQMVIEEKWIPAIMTAVQGEIDRVTQTLSVRIRELHERYSTTLPAIENEVDELSDRVKKHLTAMGAVWE